MCQWRSGLVGPDGTITLAEILGSQSHTKIRESIGYVDDKLPPDQVPVECRPIGTTITSTNPKDWKVYDDLPDEDLPDWYKQNRAELHAAVIKQHIRDVGKVTEWKFTKRLNLRRCIWLESLPDSLNVKGSLELNNCWRLKSLPDGLTVGGGLNLDSCRGLESLPKRLTVRWGLYLYGCDGITILPDDLEVGFAIYGGGPFEQR